MFTKIHMIVLCLILSISASILPFNSYAEASAASPAKSPAAHSAKPSPAPSAATAQSGAPKVICDQFADITVTIQQKEYKVFSIKKSFYAAPFKDGNITYVQLDSLLPWLGYTVSYDKVKKILTATSSTQKIIIKSGTMTYSVNGKALKLAKAPRIVSNCLMVPLESFFKALGFTIQAGTAPDTSRKAAPNALLKTVRITRFKSYDAVNFVFYDKDTSIQQFYRFDKINIFNEALKNISINELYSHDGIIVGYVYDKIQLYNKLVKYENNKFTDLKKNFNIVSTYEFGDSLVFYGYDNTDMEYKLYRFNNGVLTLVADNCYSSVQIKYKDSIILNKYDNSRNYSIIKVEKNWNVTVIDTGKTMKEFFISDNCLYIKTLPQEGTRVYFLILYNNNIVRVNLDLGVLSKLINIHNIRVCGSKIYALLPCNENHQTVEKLYQLNGSTAVKIEEDQYNSNMTLIESYKGKLYLNGIEGNRNAIRHTFVYTPGSVIKLVSDRKFADKNLLFDKSIVECGTMFLTGKVLSKDVAPLEDVMYVLRDETWNYAMDISEIRSIIQTANGLYINVNDYNRTTPVLKRDSVLFINNRAEISNIATDFKITNQSVIGSSLVYAGANRVTRRYSVNSHNGVFRELLQGYTLTYWAFIDNKVFTSGKQDQASSFNCISAGSDNNTINVSKLRDKFEVRTVLATRLKDIYLVLGTEYDKASPYLNTRVLYLYNMQSRTFTLITAGIDIKQLMIYK